MLNLLFVIGLFAVLIGFGVWNRRRNRVVVRNPRVLVLDLDTDAALAAADAAEYRQQFASVTEGVDLGALSAGTYDIVHVVARVGDGRVGRHAVADFLHAVSAAGPKLLILAANNSGDAYVAAFRDIASMPFNVAMAIERDGATFWRFIHRLFDLMFHGRTLPAAWAELAPQIPGHAHPDVPSMICRMGGGQLVFAKEAA